MSTPTTTAVTPSEPSTADTARHILMALAALARIGLTYSYRWPLAVLSYLLRCALAVGTLLLVPFRLLSLPVLLLWQAVTLPWRLVLNYFEPGDLQMIMKLMVSMVGAGMLLGLTAGFILLRLDARLCGLHDIITAFLEGRFLSSRRWWRNGRRGRVSAPAISAVDEPSETSSPRSDDGSQQESDLTPSSSLSEQSTRQIPYTVKRRLPGVLLQEIIHEEEDDDDWI